MHQRKMRGVIMNATHSEKLPVGISACLLGQEVRHDGGHRRSRYCQEVLSRYFAFQPLCPEVEAGLGTPRPALRLVNTTDGIRLRPSHSRHSDDGTDFTVAMSHFIERSLLVESPWRGFVLMAKSPSCGMERVRIYDANGIVQQRDASGLFAQALMWRYPLLPVEEAGRLEDKALCENFIERVYFYDDWQQLMDTGLTPARLLDFHSRHKFQLLAHDQAAYRQLGPLLANLKQPALLTLANTYIDTAMTAMKKLASAGSYVNVMQHLAGYLRDRVDLHTRRMINEQVNAYQQREVPLIVPMTLIRNAQKQAQQPYLGRQVFLRPYPDALGLRNAL
jgi:uncharacterized protein YbgA (DUF1722 family)/uncharacterized protein YbbK (DUF523 family)